jgi:hypothetical protein
LKCCATKAYGREERDEPLHANHHQALVEKACHILLQHDHLRKSMHSFLPLFLQEDHLRGYLVHQEICKHLQLMHNHRSKDFERFSLNVKMILSLWASNHNTNPTHLTLALKMQMLSSKHVHKQCYSLPHKP